MGKNVKVWVKPTFSLNREYEGQRNLLCGPNCQNSFVHGGRWGYVIPSEGRN